MKAFIRSIARSESGAATVEYGILLALIAATCIFMVGSLGNAIASALQNVETNF